MNIDQERRALELLNEVLDIPRSELTTYLDSIGESDEIRTRLEQLLSMETNTGNLNINCTSYIQEILEKASLIGKQIGAYRVVEEIGRGGMGGVFRGRRDDGIIEKDVAIKIMDMGLMYEKRIERFRTEQKILANMVHPNIAKLLDAGIWEHKTPYIIMELIEGLPIHEYCKKHKLSTRSRLMLFQKVCNALQYAHGHLIVHRDLKPANILVTNDGEPKLLDFGIAKLLDNDTQPTQTQGMAMTPMYASPEQLKHDNITVASDIYTMGLLLCELLTDTHPFRGKSPLERLLSLQNGDEVYPSQLIKKEANARKKQLTGDLDNLVRKAMKENPSQRYISAQQLADDVGNYLNNFPLIAEKPTYANYLKKFFRRHTLSVTMITLTFAIIVTALLVTNQSRIRAEEERDRARYISTFLENIFAVSDPYYAKKNQQEITAKALLDNAYLRMNEEVIGTQTQIKLLETIGWAYQPIDIQRSEELLRKALKMSSDKDLTHRIQKKLGLTLSQKGDFHQSVPLLKTVLQRGIEDNNDFINVTSSIGLNLLKQGKHKEAVPYFEMAINNYEQNSCDHCFNLIQSYAFLGLASLYDSDYELAWRYIHKGLIFAENNNYLDHPAMASIYFAMSGLGVFLHRSSFTSIYANKSIALYDYTERTAQEVYILHTWGMSGYHLNDFDTLQAAITRLENNDLPNRAVAYCNLQRLNSYQAYIYGDRNKSEASFLASLDCIENVYGIRSITYQTLLTELANVYHAWACDEKRDHYLALVDQDFIDEVSPNSGLFLSYYHLLALISKSKQQDTLYQQSYERLTAIFSKLEHLSFADQLPTNMEYNTIKNSYLSMEPPK